MCRWWARHCKIGSAVCPAVRRVRRRISSPARRGLRATLWWHWPPASTCSPARRRCSARPGRVCTRRCRRVPAGSVLEICRLANKIFSGYIGGQLVDALLVGGETFALMSIFGLEYAPLLAVLVGVTNIVPVLGPFLGAVPGLIILLLELPWKAAEFAIIIFVVQQVDGNFIAPRILGGATGLPGLGVLLAIVVGGAWFGIPGMVLGVPTLAVLAALLKQAVGAGLTARGLDENGEPRRNLPGGPQEN